MGGADEHDAARYRAGLAVLDRLSEAKAGISSAEVAALLGARGVKGIGGAVLGTRVSLGAAGIRLAEAVRRRSVRGRTTWTAGPRIRLPRRGDGGGGHHGPRAGESKDAASAAPRPPRYGGEAPECRRRRQPRPRQSILDAG